jgi:hypothetical protein
MDGLARVLPEPLRVVRKGLRYGVAANGKVAWLPADMWANAAEFTRRLESMQSEIKRLTRETDRVNALIDAAKAEADAAGGVQTPWDGPRG